MRKSILRLITLCATVALLCGAMLCFSLTSAEAANLIVNGDFSNGLTGWTVSKMDGATVTNGQLVINQPEIDNGTVSASFAGTIKASTEYTIRYDATNVQNLEVKVHYTQGFGGNDGGMLTIPANQNFTFSTSESLQAGDFSVEIGGTRYSDVTGTLDNFILVEGSTISGDVTTPSSSETTPSSSETTPSSSETTPSETQPSQQGGSTELTGNWTAMSESHQSRVSYSNGTLTLDATGGDEDVKASQKVTLAAGSYRFSATKSGEPAPDLMVRTAAGDVPEGKYDEAGHVDFTLSAQEEVTFIISQYRGTMGTLSNIQLTGGGSQPTTPSSSETTPSSSETTPSETQPSQQGGSTELTGNWVAMSESHQSRVSYSNGTLTLDATGGDEDVKASQKVTLAAGSYRFSATKTGEPAPDLMVRTAAGDVPEGKYDEAGHVDFTLSAQEEVTIIISQYRGTMGTLSNIQLTGGGSQPTTPSSSETTPSASGSETQPTSAPTSGNLIVNGSFNNGISGWTLTNIDENSAKVQDGALVVNQANGWHVDIRPTISGTIKGNTQYTLKYEASNVNNLQVTVHLAPGFGGGASIQAAPGETTFTTAADLTANDFYVTIEIIADGDVSGTFDNFVLVEGTNTDVTDPSVDPSQSGTQPSTNPSQNPGQVGKIVVWSGTISRDFTTKNTVAIINVDELTQAFRNDLTANGLPQKYEIEAVASYTSGPSDYASWGFYQDSPYLELWSDEGASLTNAVISGRSKAKTPLSSLTNAASLCLFSDDSGDMVNVQSLTLYAYREGGTTNPSSSETTPSSSETTPSSSETTPSSSETTPSGSETDPSTSETTPSQPTDGKALVWAGNLGADYTTGDGGVAPIQNQEMMMAVVGELMTNGIPEKIEIKSELGYLGGPSNFAAIGLYSNGQVIWPDADCTDLSDVTFSNLSGLGADTALVVFSYGAGDTLHIDGMEIYAYRAQPSQSETEPTGISTPGDANGDGALNMKDVLVLRKFLADLPVEMDEAAADVNGDGAINMKDVLQMRKIIANS